LPTIVAREPGGMKAKIKKMKKEKENLHYIRKGNEGIQERKCGYHIATGQYITPFRTKQKRRQKFELQHSLCDEMVSN
jgi:translation initiation factor IF-2